jgi:hypothetical protein
MRAQRALRAPFTSISLAMSVALFFAAASPTSRAQDRAPSGDPTVTALIRALQDRLTLWRGEARVVYVRHCRDAPGGCPARIGTFARMMSDAADTHRLDPFLLAAVAVRESGMNPLAASQAGERGIVQLHPRGPGRGVEFVQSESYRARCALRPDVCQDEVLSAGARLLSRAIERCGGVREGLGAYNRGSCGETDYSRRVMSERQRLLRLAKGESAPPA